MGKRKVEELFCEGVSAKISHGWQYKDWPNDSRWHLRVPSIFQVLPKRSIYGKLIKLKMYLKEEEGTYFPRGSRFPVWAISFSLLCQVISSTPSSVGHHLVVGKSLVSGHLFSLHFLDRSWISHWARLHSSNKGLWFILVSEFAILVRWGKLLGPWMTVLESNVVNGGSAIVNRSRDNINCWRRGGHGLV